MDKSSIDNIKSKIRDALQGHSGQIEVKFDGFDAWQIKVISNLFEDMTDSARRKWLKDSLGDEKVSLRYLITESENIEEGNIPLIEQPELPLWPESLARGEAQLLEDSLVTFLSDLDKGYEPPITVTFYSLRGGVGRSTTMAHTARLLAREGKRVVCLDMDLEAPGLSALFGVEEKVIDNQGIVNLLLQIDQGIEPDYAKHLVPVEDEQGLFIIPAGIPNAAYARDLSFIEPSVWYSEQENPLKILMEGIRSKLPFIPDVILIDSRTGISAISAPLLFEQADLAVVVFFPHQQAFKGTESLVHGLMGACNWRNLNVNGTSCGPDIRFVVGPVPSGNKEISDRMRNRSLEWISNWMNPIQKIRLENGYLELDEGEIFNWIPYREEVATSKDVFDVSDIKGLYGGVADWIRGLLSAAEQPTSKEIPSEEKVDILSEIKIEDGAAENNESENLRDLFIETDIVKDALSKNNPLVLGRKGTGKTALFFKISAESNEDNLIIPVLSPSRKNSTALSLDQDLLQVLDRKIVKLGNLGWREVWMIYALLLAERDARISRKVMPTLLNLDKLPTKGTELVRAIENATKSNSMFGLELKEAFAELEDVLEHRMTFLWDGLDTRFGNTFEERHRRKEALIGLLSFILEWEKEFSRIHFKVLLREDIWRQLSFENKSHLYGRSVFLKWSDQYTFLKVILKQLWRSDSLREYIESRMTENNLASPGKQIEKWDDQTVVQIWNLICGTRMGGGKTAFTRNWVWTRLGDANDDHAPRHLLQLFNAAIKAELDQEKRLPYNRSLIRPNTLVKVLPEVSKLALDALIQEEFKELEALQTKLIEIAKTPFSAEDLRDQRDEDISLALEVGLLGIHEGTDSDVERYRVPELYRLGLKMTRKGQA